MPVYAFEPSIALALFFSFLLIICIRVGSREPSITHSDVCGVSLDRRSEVRAKPRATIHIPDPLIEAKRPATIHISDPLTKANIESIRSIFVQFVHHFGLDVKSKLRYDYDLEQTCLEQLSALGIGYGHTSTRKFQTAMTAAISIFCFAFNHHSDPKTREWLCLWIVLAIYIDDYFQDDVEPLRDFGTRLMMGKRQKDEVLDAFVVCTARAGDYFGDVMASMIVKGTLDFIIGMVVEYDHQASETLMQPKVEQYPRFVRALSGAALSFAVFFWLKAIPADVYIQIIPDLCDWLNYVNDVFSFYKEELACETTNYISILASISHKPKVEVHRELATECIAIADRMKLVLKDHEEAYSILMERSIRGYMNYHLATGRRYRLDELELERVG